MKQQTILAFLISLLVSGCSSCKDEFPTEYGKLNVVWRHDYGKKIPISSYGPTIYKDHAIYANLTADLTGDLVSINAKDGDDMNWKWENAFHSGSYITQNGMEVFKDNILVAQRVNGLNGVDMESGKVIWKQQFSTSATHSVLGDHIYKYQDWVNSLDLRRINMKTGAMEVLYSIDTFSTPFSSITMPSFIIESDGDTIAYFGISCTYQNTDFSLFGKRWFVAFNLTQKQTVWIKENMSPFSVSDGLKNIYLETEDSIISLDPQNGAVIWATKLMNQTGGPIYFQDGKILIIGQGVSTTIQAYDPDSGNLVWEIPFDGNTSLPVFYKGIMYFTCASDGKIWAVRLSNGERIWHEKSPNDEGWTSSIGFDPIRNKIFSATYTAAYCLEPAE
jgi:outer membrane protein assembly factor BamB